MTRIARDLNYGDGVAVNAIMAMSKSDQPDPKVDMLALSAMPHGILPWGVKTLQTWARGDTHEEQTNNEGICKCAGPNRLLRYLVW
jgi:hypothetical protein